MNRILEISLTILGGIAFVYLAAFIGSLPHDLWWTQPTVVLSYVGVICLFTRALERWLTES